MVFQIANDLNFSIQIQRRVIRLGEHDLTTLDDGPNLDVPVAHAKKHEHYDEDLDINDIAMITLEDDVEFTGKFHEISPFD